MQRVPLRFKLLPSKDLLTLLTRLGVPNIQHETMERPTPEDVTSIYQHISEFAYDTEVHMVKQRVNANVVQYMEIFDDALDVLAIFKLARQLAEINGLDDFNFKDFWEPQGKRFRAVCSGMVNFCRYKESKTVFLAEGKEQLHELELERAGYVEKNEIISQELQEAMIRNNEELQERWRIESEVQDKQNVVQKLQKQRQQGDRVQEDEEAKKTAAKERLADVEQRCDEKRKHIDNLKEQVAESPEGLEQEIHDLQQAIKQQKARLEERNNEKRSRQQRTQTLSSAHAQMEQYGRVLEKAGQVAAQKSTVGERTRAAQQEYVALRARCEATVAETLQHQQAIGQVTAEMDTAKEAHAQEMHQCEERREQAMMQLRDLQSKRTEEQKQADLHQQQRLELLAELSETQRTGEASITDLREQLQGIKADDAAYIQSVDAMLANYDAQFGRSLLGASCPMASPGSARGQRYRAPFGSKESCSPKSVGPRWQPATLVPRRLNMDRSGFN